MNNLSTFWKGTVEKPATLAPQTDTTLPTIIPVTEQFHSDGAPIARGDALNQLNTRPSVLEEAENLANSPVGEKSENNEQAGAAVVDVITAEPDEKPTEALADEITTTDEAVEEKPKEETSVVTEETKPAEKNISFNQAKENVEAMILATERQIKNLQVELQTIQNKIEEITKEKNEEIANLSERAEKIDKRLAILSSVKGGLEDNQSQLGQIAEAVENEI